MSWDKNVQVEKVEGDYAYLTSLPLNSYSNERFELIVVDIRNPYFPLEVNSFYVGGSVVIQSPYAYVYAADTLKIYNVSDPNNPSLDGFKLLDQQMISFFVSGNYFYSISNEEFNPFDSTLSKLHIFDVADPANISEVGFLENIDDPVNGLFVRGDYAYLSSFSFYHLPVNAPLRIIDVSNPAVPVQIGAFTGWEGWDGQNIYLSGSYAYLSSRYHTWGDFIIYVVDISDPRNPFKVGDYIVAEPGHLSQIVDDYAYVCIDHGLAFLNVNDPTSIDFAGFYDVGNQPIDFQVCNNSIFIAGKGGYYKRRMKILNINNPTNPFEICSYKSSITPRAIWIQNNIAYVARRFYWESPDLLILNVTNPAYPDSIGSFSFGSAIVDIMATESFCYLSNANDSSLCIMDVSNPTNPSIVGIYNANISPRNFFKYGNYVYLIEYGEGLHNDLLHIVDVSDPTNPYQAGLHDLVVFTTGMHDIFVEGELAFVSTVFGLKILDVSDPSILNVLHTSGSGEVFTCFAKGNYAYVMKKHDLDVLDISNPTSPVKVGNFHNQNFYGEGSKLFVQSNLIYLTSPSGFKSGLYIFEYNEPSDVDITNEYLPVKFSLFQNFPNPFNPSTKIKYSVPQTSQVQIKVFDVLGNEIETIVNEEKPVGTYVITWFAEGLPSGIYIYRLQAGNFVETKKMVLMK